MAQPSIRLNDVDNVGRTGRHMTCFTMGTHTVINKEDDFIYWQTSYEDYYISKYTDTEIEISDNIWEAIDYSDMDKDEIDEIIKDVKNHYKPKKDYRIQLKKVKATI